MIRNLGIAGLGLIFLFGQGAAGQQTAGAQAGEATPAGPVKVIEVTAKKYEYTPGEIHVKKGTRVQLKLRAIDRTHGFKLALYPDGAAESGPAGLRLTDPQESWKLEKEQERVVEFTADRAGTYSFKCSNFCGMGHRGMHGKLVVEE